MGNVYDEVATGTGSRSSDALASGREFRWTTDSMDLLFAAPEDSPVRLTGIGIGTPARRTAASQPLVELMITGDGRSRTTTRFTNTGVGSRLRYVNHELSSVDDEDSILIVQSDPVSGLTVTTTMIASPSVAGARVTTSVVNDGTTAQVLEAISSFAFGAVLEEGDSPEDLVLHAGTGEQLAENRWSRTPLYSQALLADFNSAWHRQPGRGSFAAVGTASWSTARALPTGVVENELTGRSVAWQIEHNGAWRWEVDDVRHGQDAFAVVLLGPEDLDHHWSEELLPGECFSSVPVSVVFSDGGFDDAVGVLTSHRRWLRRTHTREDVPLLVFNDFMNTIDGDPTSERLLPLIAAAAAAGAECFCIDAGWYDDTDLGDWWPSVGEWLPSARRFPDGGLASIVAAIRRSGMKVGLWLEPEVVGVLSPVAQALPDAAFLQRHGRRVQEHQRYFLDLRHPDARAHIDATVDRLVRDLGIDFFKLDYNVNTGPGTDFDAFSVGAGLLAHNRAHLQWVIAMRRRHPEVIFENCSSGAMRADFGLLQLFDLQSTSDQQDFRLYPAIAAAAPVQMLPEQAGNWAYPQATMSHEEIAFTLTTGLSGRLYLSGFLDRMTAAQFELVQSATALFKELRADLVAALPRWPLGLPDWNATTLALELRSPGRRLLMLWHRGGEDASFLLRLGEQVTAVNLLERFPVRLQPWSLEDVRPGIIRVTPVAGPSARVFEISEQ